MRAAHLKCGRAPPYGITSTSGTIAGPGPRCNPLDHHVIFRSAGGSDAPENRITLCAFHHQRCVHAGLLRVRGRAPDALVFELGLRAGAPPLARYGSGDVGLAAA